MDDKMKRLSIQKLKLCQHGKNALILARTRFKAHTGIVFGSFARDDMRADSDIDLLLLSDSRARIGSFYNDSRITDISPPLSVIVYRPNDFDRFHIEGSLFSYHVLNEGIVLWDDGTFEAISSRPFHLKRDFSNDIQEQCDKLVVFRDPKPFNGILLHVYARLWRILKNIVFFSIAAKGKPEFNKEKAFDQFYILFPAAKRMRRDFTNLEECYRIAVRGVKYSKHLKAIESEFQLRDYLKQIDQIRNLVLD